MKPFVLSLVAFCLVCNFLPAQTVSPAASDAPKPAPEKNALKFNISPDGSHYFQVTFLNQTWARFNQSNAGTTAFGKSTDNTFDIGLRRTRMQMFGQINDRTFIYFQFGQNNFNSAFNYTGNRKLAPFFHDAVCELKVSRGNQLKIGGGLTVLNALSRFSQPSVSSIMTLDLPVFLQFTVDQTDQFDRRLALYARGQLKQFDYRIYISNPFPVNSSGANVPALGTSANFVNTSAFNNSAYPKGYGPGINNQFGGYFTYNFFENESHTTPYMTGTYLGSKKVFNVSLGGVFQKNATWRVENFDNTLKTYRDTVYENMMHFSFETYLDMPLNTDKGTAISAFAGYYNTNYGKNYLRYNGIMNPATGAASSATATMVQSTAYGNAFPMFGTGQVVYSQLGYLLPKSLLGEKNGQLMPYLSGQYADYSALQNKPMLVFDAGVNWLIQGHKSKISIDYQSRPVYAKDANSVISQNARKGCLMMQYQIFF